MQGVDGLGCGNVTWCQFDGARAFNKTLGVFNNVIATATGKVLLLLLLLLFVFWMVWLWPTYTNLFLSTSALSIIQELLGPAKPRCLELLGSVVFHNYVPLDIGSTYFETPTHKKRSWCINIVHFYLYIYTHMFNERSFFLMHLFMHTKWHLPLVSWFPNPIEPTDIGVTSTEYYPLGVSRCSIVLLDSH